MRYDNVLPAINDDMAKALVIVMRQLSDPPADRQFPRISAQTWQARFEQGKYRPGGRPRKIKP